MKTEPALKVEGKTPWKRLDKAVLHIFTVSKEDVLKEEVKKKRARTKKPPRRKAIA